MRYFGGKAKIAGQISQYINKLAEGLECNTLEENLRLAHQSQNILIPHTHTHTHYVEPFCGSCNVASKVNIENKTLNDKHPYLIAMFKALQKGWIPPKVITEEQYKFIKGNRDEDVVLSGFVGFGCSFAGKWFDTYARSNGERNYALNAHNSILKKMKTLMEAEFTCKDFKELDFENSIIYCDPPYKNTNQYNKELLGEFPYDIFLEWVKEQSKKNTVLVSEYKCNVPEDAIVLLEIHSQTDIRRGVHGERINTIEVLYTYNQISQQLPILSA